MRREKRFTLIEIIVVVALASLLLLGLFALVGTSATARNATRERDIAREAARAMLEQVLATPFDQIEATYGTPGNPTYFPAGAPPNQLTVPTQADTFQAPAPAPRGVVWPNCVRVDVDTATPPASPGGTGLKRIIVRVRWIGSDNRVNNFELSSYAANRDP